MKKLLILLLAGYLPSAFAEPVAIEVHDITSEKGNIIINVYDDEDSWLEEKAKYIFQQQISPLSGQVNDGVLSVTIDLPAGEYALHIYQDWDFNKEMDSNWIGMPKEPVATSNNAKGSMGPPNYEDAKFKVEGDNTTQKVNLVEI